MNKVKFVLFMAGVSLALGFVFGCSSDDGGGNSRGDNPSSNSVAEISSSGGGSSSDGSSLLSSSNGGNNHSSSSSTGISSSGGGSSSGNSSSSSIEQSSSAVLQECDAIFNPANKFCYDGTIYDKCDGMLYNPTTHICQNKVATPAKCGNEGYNPLTQRCNDSIVQDKCGNNWYSQATQFCYDGKAYALCGGESYNLLTQSCYDNIVYDKKYGEPIIDTRDGKEYKTTVIHTQTWMATNLNYIPISGKHKCYAEGNGSDSWLLPGSAEAKANCDKYGRLYDWATAMALPASCNESDCSSQISEKHKGICPNGWHIPSNAEWTTLNTVGGSTAGTKLKAITGWKETSTSDKGIDSYGFGAIGSGYCVSCDKLSDATGYYNGASREGKESEGTEAHWWSATEYVNKNVTPNDATRAYKSKITYYKKEMTLEFEKKADYLYSVRCIKD